MSELLVQAPLAAAEEPATLAGALAGAPAVLGILAAPVVPAALAKLFDPLALRAANLPSIQLISFSPRITVAKTHISSGKVRGLSVVLFQTQCV